MDRLRAAGDERQRKDEERLPRMIEPDELRQGRDQEVGGEVRQDVPFDPVKAREQRVVAEMPDRVEPREMVGVVGEGRNVAEEDGGGGGGQEKRAEEDEP